MRAGMLVVLFMCACATQKVTQFKDEGPRVDRVIHCYFERPTGSNYMDRVCMFDDEQDLGDSSIDDGFLALQRRALQHVKPRT